MEVVYLDNRNRSIRSAVEEAMESADRASIAVAYSSPDGVESIEAGLSRLSDRGGRARLLAGLDDLITDLRAVERFADLPGAECKVFLPTTVGDRARFHPKMYVFEGREESSVIVGSGNLTGAGLEGNYEASLWLRARSDEPMLQAVGESFGLLWENPRAMPLTDRVRREYEAARQARKAALGQVAELEAYRQWRRAVRASLAKFLAQGSSSKWLMVTSPTNFKICLKLGRWGDEQWNRISRVQPGDAIVFYITGQHRLGGIAVALTQARISHERPWPDRPYPYQMDIQFLNQPEPQLSIRPLISRLDLFGHSELGWGQRLQTTLRPLSDADFQLLSEAVGAADLGVIGGHG